MTLGDPVSMPTLNLGQTPLRAEAWKQALAEYPDRASAEFVVNAITEGASINFEGDRSNPVIAPNLSTALENKQVIEEWLAEELRLGRIFGPFTEPPLENMRISPLGVVPKDGTKFRIINHMSFPRKGNSLNAAIGDMECNLGSFDEAVKLVSEEGCCWLVKIDVQSAFRLVPVRREDWHLLGVLWEGRYFLDVCLPFGMKTSPSIWERFSRALRWILKKKLGIAVTHYVDDFLLIIPQQTDAQRVRNEALDIFNALGVPWSRKKLVGPTTSLEYLGIGIDSESKRVYIPEPKRINAIEVVTNAAASTSMARKEFQSVLGRLFFLTRVIPQGRAFLARGIALLRGSQTRQIKMTEGFRADLQWWASFLPTWPGISWFYHDNWDGDAVELYSDASEWGAGARFGNKWFSMKWSQNQLLKARRTRRISMPYLEMLALATAVNTWKKDLAGKNAWLIVDCMPVVFAVGKLFSPQEEMMALIREMVGWSIEGNFMFRARHIPTHDNKIADTLSRNQTLQLQELLPSADQDASEPATVVR